MLQILKISEINNLILTTNRKKNPKLKTKSFFLIYLVHIRGEKTKRYTRLTNTFLRTIWNNGQTFKHSSTAQFLNLMRDDIRGALTAIYYVPVSFPATIGMCCEAGATQSRSCTALGHLSPWLNHQPRPAHNQRKPEGDGTNRRQKDINSKQLNLTKLYRKLNLISQFITVIFFPTPIRIRCKRFIS